MSAQPLPPFKSAAALFNYLHALGIRLSIGPDGTLRGVPGVKITAELAAHIERFNTDLLDIVNGATGAAITPIRPDATVAPANIVPSKTTDVANAERFAKQHGGDLRFCHPFNKWLAYDKGRWAIDNVAEVERRTKETARSIYREAADEPIDAVRIELSKHAVRSEGEARIRAMMSLGKSEPGIPVLPEALDADPWLLNVENGTINLRTAQVQPHDRADLITKIAPVIYDASATCPTFDAFLARIQPNQSTRTFIQRMAGYSLTGDTREDVLLIAYGGGANGKTTLMQTLQAMMGDYAMQTPSEMLMVKRNEGIPNDVARLKGARLVAASEVEEGKRLAESLIKQLTGGDRITARFLHGEFFEFDPTFKIVLSTNHKPIIRGTDLGTWRRLRLIPFTVTIPEDERDETLPAKLRAELPGILNWALTGCRDWLKSGLGMPEEVKGATKAYRDEMDIVGNWIRDCCIEGDQYQATAAELYASYERWCEENGERAMSQSDLGKRLSERGFESARGHAGKRYWRGIGLLSPDGTRPPKQRPLGAQPQNDHNMGDAGDRGDAVSKVSAHERIFKSKTPEVASPASPASPIRSESQVSVFSLTEPDVPTTRDNTECDLLWDWLASARAGETHEIPEDVRRAAHRRGFGFDAFADIQENARLLMERLAQQEATP